MSNLVAMVLGNVIFTFCCIGVAWVVLSTRISDLQRAISALKTDVFDYKMRLFAAHGGERQATRKILESLPPEQIRKFAKGIGIDPDSYGIPTFDWLEDRDRREGHDSESAG